MSDNSGAAVSRTAKSDADPGQAPNEDDVLTLESADLTGAPIEYA